MVGNWTHLYALAILSLTHSPCFIGYFGEPTFITCQRYVNILFKFILITTNYP